MTTRRRFLTQLGVGIAAVALAPREMFALPPATRRILYGDGIHDDTEALQAWLNGEEVFRVNGSVMKPYELRGGTYRVGHTLQMRSAVTISDASFEHCGEGVLLDAQGSCGSIVISNCTIKGCYTPQIYALS